MGLYCQLNIESGKMTLTPRILVNDQAQGKSEDLIKVLTLWMTVLLSRQEMKGLKGEIVADYYWFSFICL